MEPERKPSRSRVTQEKPSSRRPATRRARRSGWTRSARASVGTSTRARPPWSRTRSWARPKERSRASARSTRDRRAGGTRTPEAIREARQAAAGVVGGGRARGRVAQVVHVGPDGQGQALGAGQRAEHLEQLVLAEEAAVGAVAQVAGPLALVGGHPPAGGAQ